MQPKGARKNKAKLEFPELTAEFLENAKRELFRLWTISNAIAAQQKKTSYYEALKNLEEAVYLLKQRWFELSEEGRQAFLASLPDPENGAALFSTPKVLNYEYAGVKYSLADFEAISAEMTNRLKMTDIPKPTDYFPSSDGQPTHSWKDDFTEYLMRRLAEVNKGQRLTCYKLTPKNGKNRYCSTETFIRMAQEALAPPGMKLPEVSALAELRGLSPQSSLPRVLKKLV